MTSTTSSSWRSVLDDNDDNNDDDDISRRLTERAMVEDESTTLQNVILFHALFLEALRFVLRVHRHTIICLVGVRRSRHDIYCCDVIYNGSVRYCFCCD